MPSEGHRQWDKAAQAIADAPGQQTLSLNLSLVTSPRLSRAAQPEGESTRAQVAAPKTPAMEPVAQDLGTDAVAASPPQSEAPMLCVKRGNELVHLLPKELKRL